jgi:very-short-patch-repair endonuclease
VGALASGQHALVTYQQLVALGVGRGAIDHALACGRLVPIHRGVYALAHSALPPLAGELAAVFACGEAACLSHHSAAGVWGVRPRQTDKVEVTVVGRDAARGRAGIHVHRARALDPRDIRRYQNIPITSPARMMLDIAADLSERELELAVDEGIIRRLVTRHAIRVVLLRYPGRRGSARLAALTDEARSSSISRSEAEERMLALVRKGGLPAPELNARIGRWTVDFLWRREKLVVEIDGYRYHSSRARLERDHDKDIALRSSGLEVVRFTRAKLVREQPVVLVMVAQMLALRAPGVTDR